MNCFFTNRQNGVSQGPHKSLNLALHVGDSSEDVAKNREILSKKAGTTNLVFMDQIHSDNIETITNKATNRVLKTDGIITNIKDIALCVMVADCIPILFYDETKKVIAAAHAGRDGVRQKIANKLIQKMVKEFSCKVKDIKVYIGPSIKSCCYEVKNDVTDGFEKYLIFRGKKIYLDIVQKCIDDIKEIGVKEENIETSSVCTCCDKDYFSYRRDGKTGRFCGVIVL